MHTHALHHFVYFFLCLIQHLVTVGGITEDHTPTVSLRGTFPEFGPVLPLSGDILSLFLTPRTILIHAQMKLGSGVIQKGCSYLDNQ